MISDDILISVYTDPTLIFQVVKLQGRCLRRAGARLGISPSFSYWKSKLESVYPHHFLVLRFVKFRNHR
jgi:hypothetical protein